MCTVTIVPRDDEGFRVMCNRDERRTRPAALAPCLHRLSRRVAVFPTDPLGGGTWIGVNDAGLAMAILNRCGNNDARPTSSQPVLVSRGLVIPRLLEYDDLDAALAVARTLTPARFEPFQLVAIQSARVGVLTSDGHTLAAGVSGLCLPLLFTSSSLGDETVQEPRRRLFERLVLDEPDGWLFGQSRLHRHQWPDSPELSVRMERADARTVSRSVVDVTSRAITFHYEPLHEVAEAA